MGCGLCVCVCVCVVFFTVLNVFYGTFDGGMNSYVIGISVRKDAVINCISV